METSSSDESTGTCSYDGDVSVAIVDNVAESNLTQIFTELLELKKYEDGYQVLLTYAGNSILMPFQRYIL